VQYDKSSFPEPAIGDPGCREELYYGYFTEVLGADLDQLFGAGRQQ
jgi:hypothetical protein